MEKKKKKPWRLILALGVFSRYEVVVILYFRNDRTVDALKRASSCQKGTQTPLKFYYNAK